MRNKDDELFLKDAPVENGVFVQVVIELHEALNETEPLLMHVYGVITTCTKSLFSFT